MDNDPLRIKVMLAERMVSNKELAEKLGKNPVIVSNCVTKKISQPSLEKLIEVARCLKCEITELVRTPSHSYCRFHKLIIHAYKQKRIITIPDTRSLLQRFP